jgi:hypothetical protein
MDERNQRFLFSLQEVRAQFILNGECRGDYVQLDFLSYVFNQKNNSLDFNNLG